MLKVQAAARVGERRWTLYLDNGVKIDLPEEDVDAALRRVAELDATQNILSKGIREIDLRTNDRIVIALAEAVDPKKADDENVASPAELKTAGSVRHAVGFELGAVSMTRGSPLGFRSKGRATVVASGPVAVLDLGSTKISCVIAEPAERFVQGPGLSQRPAHQWHWHHRLARYQERAISNIEDAERAIRIAVDAAERMAKQHCTRRPRECFRRSSGFLACPAHVKTQTGVVSPRDIEHAVSAAIGKADIGKRHILHLNPVGYSLDGVTADRPPLGMHGEVLGVEVGIVTLDAAHLRNLTLAVERAHLKVARALLCRPMPPGVGTLFKDELVTGHAGHRHGGRDNELCAVPQRQSCRIRGVAVGAAHVTADMAQGLPTTLAHAERLKTMFGSVLPFAHEDREMLAVPLLGERGVDAIQQVPKHVLNSIILPRLEETIEMVRQDIERHGCAGSDHAHCPHGRWQSTAGCARSCRPSFRLPGADWPADPGAGCAGGRAAGGMAVSAGSSGPVTQA